MIRPATAEDLPVVRRIVEAAYAPHAAVIGRRPAPMDEDHAAQIAAGQVWIAPPNGVIVLADTAEGLFVNNLAVHPDAQGHGIGRALLAFAEAEARRRGRARLHLYTHARMTANIALYRRLGWRETHRALQDGFDRVFMEKPA
ncbi:MAG TPA: GNAT family N-acetyltransferase [Falsiroseomonas sp.]|jgi:GNAT superfamily N-acetyltransferase|nr:GNAT family N-acetyltransferase [Falsiroseomonas sp.]